MVMRSVELHTQRGDPLLKPDDEKLMGAVRARIEMAGKGFFT